MTTPQPDPKRVNYIGAPDYFNLNHAVASVAEAFGHSCYLVGSACVRRDYRDIDVRCIVPDEEFDVLFGGWSYATHNMNPRLSLMNASISEWLRKTTGLPVDFQFQRRTEANAEYPTMFDEVLVINGVEHKTRVKIRERQPIGMYLSRRQLSAPEADR